MSYFFWFQWFTGSSGFGRLSRTIKRVYLSTHNVLLISFSIRAPGFRLEPLVMPHKTQGLGWDQRLEPDWNQG